jgi:hypothetical protein
VISDRDLGKWGHWKKILSDEIDATFIQKLYADGAVAAGLKVLPVEPFGYLGHTTLTTHRDVVEKDRSAAETLVRAAFDATQMFKSEPGVVIDLLSSELWPSLTNLHDQKVERVYEIFRDELPAYPVPSVEGLTNMRNMAKKADPDLESFDPLEMWDLSFAGKLLHERAAANG